MHKQSLPLNPYHAAYWEQGTGTPLVFLHGFLGEGSVWQPICEALPHYRCIALDLLGFGDSSKPELRYNIWHQVEFVQQFVTALDLEPFWLVGHSYGGWTAAAYAIACGTGQLGLPPRPMPSLQPELKGLGLIAPAGIRDDQFVGRYAHLRPLLWETPWVDWGLSVIASLSGWVRQRQAIEQICQVRQALRSQPVAKSFLKDRLRPEDAIDTVEASLAAIQVPTVVIAAGKDDTIPLWHCQAYSEGIPHAYYHLFPEADHGLLQTEGVAIAQLLHQQIDLTPD